MWCRWGKRDWQVRLPWVQEITKSPNWLNGLPLVGCVRTPNHTRALAGTEAFQRGTQVCSNISRVMLFSVPLCNSAAHYYYLVYLWLSFIPSLPLALRKANNYNTLKVLYKHRALKNQSYLFALQLLSIQLFLPKCHLVQKSSPILAYWIFTYSRCIFMSC